LLSLHGHEMLTATHDPRVPSLFAPLGATSMTNFAVNAVFGTFSTAILWGGVAVVAAIFAILLVSESSSGARAPSYQRGTQPGKLGR